MIGKRLLAALLFLVLPAAAHAQFNTGGVGGITSLTPGCGATASPNPITHTGVFGTAIPVTNTVTTTPYTIQASDACGLLVLGAGAVVLTLPNTATAGFGANSYWRLDNQSGGAITINVTAPSNIEGSSSISVVDATAMAFQSDGSNYHYVVRSAPGIGTVTSFTGACGIATTPSPLVNAGTVSSSIAQTLVTAASPPITAAYCGGLVQLSGSVNLNATIAQAGSSGFAAGTNFTLCNIGNASQTLTPTGGTIGGLPAYTLTSGTAAAPVCVSFVSDGASNYVLIAGSSAIGGVSTQNGTTYTFAASDCGTTIRFTSGSAVTATIPQGLPVGCIFGVVQVGTGKVSVNGTAVSAAALNSAYGFVATAQQFSTIGLFIDASNDAILTGDGS